MARERRQSTNPQGTALERGALPWSVTASDSWAEHEEDDGGHPGAGLLSPEVWAEVASALHLTPREWEVVKLLFEGESREHTASLLKTSVHTVRRHLERIYRKLDVCDQVGLVLRIVRVRDELVCGGCSRRPLRR